MPKRSEEAKRDEFEENLQKARRDTYGERWVYTTVRDLGDKANWIPPANPQKHYKNRSKYDANGNLIT
jgi:hypothetical protein